MTRDIRIVFMGTPDFAVATLKALLENNYQIVGVITAPDKPAGRGRKLNESAVKTFAVANGLHIMQPTNLKHEDFLEELKSLHANLQIVVAFRMLPKVVWSMPKYGTFNLHASLLPNYRGAAPINWAIINGESKTGVTTFFIDDKIDTGEMILQKELSIDPDENAGSLHDKLMETGSALVIDTVQAIQEGTVTTYAQAEDATIKTAHKLNRDNCKIDWSASLNQIYNKIRGLSPYPAAWSSCQNGEEFIEVKIYASEIIHESHEYSVGSIITTKKDIKVAVKGGFILIKELQLPGKKKMDSSSLLNGYSFYDNAKML